MLNNRSKAESRDWSSGATTLQRLSTMSRAASTIWNSGVKRSLRACDVPPPGQGGIQILAAVTVADVAVVAVSVIMQHKFQQSLFMNPWCLIQFINRVVVFQLLYRDRQVCTALVVQKTWRFHSCRSWTSLLCPFCGATSLGTDSAEFCGIASGAAPVVLWTLL